MSGEEEIADIDPTPIHHPVDDDAIASAVKDAAAEVADETMDHEFDSDVIHHQDEVEVEDERVNNDDHDNDKTSIKEDEARTADSENIRAMILKEDEERINKSKAPKRRARRVGKVPVRKVPKLGEPPVLEERVEPPVVEEIVAEPSVVDTLPRVLSKHDEKWNSMLRELEAFKEKHGNTSVPQCFTQNPRLGRWVHYQRVEYWVFQETGGGKITPERIGRLEAMGFEWDPQKAQWDKMFERLKEYHEEMGHCKVPKGYTHDPELANWVRNQRLEHANMNKGKKSRMTMERYKKLDDLGFKWSSITGKSTRIATNSAESAKGNDKSDSQQPLADSVNEESCKLENSSKLDEGAVTNPGDDDDMREVVVHEEKTDVSAHSALTELVSEDVNSKSFAEPSLKESVKDESAERSTIEV